MIDLQVKIAILAAIAWWATRRATPANAASAHRVWLVVLAAPALWLLGEGLLSPLVHARVRGDLLPGAVSTRSGSLLWGAASVYVAVAALLLVRIGAGILSVRRLLRSARPLEASERRSLPLARGLDLREAALDVPVTAGFIRPAILFPINWRDLPPSALEAIVLHETAHVRRRDCAIGLCCTVLEAVFWFNPFVWLAGRKLRFLAEMACDAEAASGMDRGVYAAELLKLSVAWRGTRRPRYAITAGAESHVARRINLLLDDLERGCRRRSTLAILAMFLLIAIPLAGVVQVGGVGPVESSGSSFGPLHRAVHQLRHQH